MGGGGRGVGGEGVAGYGGGGLLYIKCVGGDVCGLNL